MAHDFSLTQKSNRENAVFFFGFYGGIAYKAFNAQNFNNGMSGSNDGKFVTKEQAIKGVEFMLTAFKKDKNYQSEIKAFTDYLNNVIIPSDDSEQFSAHYS